MPLNDTINDIPLLIIAGTFLLKVFDPDTLDRKLLTGEQRKFLSSLRETRLKLATNLFHLANLTIEKALNIESTTQPKKQTKT